MPEPVREKLDSEESESVVSRIGTDKKSPDCFKLAFSWQQPKNGTSHFELLSEPEPLAPWSLIPRSLIGSDWYLKFSTKYDYMQLHFGRRLNVCMFRKIFAFYHLTSSFG